MSDRATRWSVTWYPTTNSMDYDIAKKEIEEYAQRPLGPGWQIEGQMEQCPETGRYHYQALLKTPQVRMSAVIRAMDKAHIEISKNAKGLEQYVHKPETRVAEIEKSQKIPSIFEYQGIIAKQWVEEDFQCRWQAAKKLEKMPDINDVAMKYIQSLVSADIRNGRRGAEWIAVNPMWIQCWKNFWRDIITRDGPVAAKTRTCEEAAVSPAPQNAEAQEQ